MDQATGYACPSCGEWVEVVLDPSAGRHQEYVEDCPVCCRPNVLRVDFDRRGRASVAASPE